MRRKLTAHFHEDEIFDGHKPTEHERWLGEVLARETLEPVREIVKAPIFINDGWRDWERWKYLNRIGAKPARTTDHTFGLEYYQFGVGAADLLKLRRTRSGNLTREDFTEQDYNKIIDELGDDPPWGQLIWYRSTGHMHVANKKSLVFSDAMIRRHRWDRKKPHYIKETS